MSKQALVVWGGWDGHQPKPCVDRFIPFLQQNGYAVTVRDSLDVYADAAVMGKLDLIVQCWTMGQISGDQWKGLTAAVNGGCGLAGWHGGLCDSFRGHTDYLAMTGGQFLAHPGGIIDYEVHITDWDDPIVAGISDFKMKSEQYYMVTDPGNLVLATTTFGGVHDPLRKGVTMPVAWKRRWGKGRVFYSALGHVAADFDVPEARTIMERGLMWAAR